MGLGCGIPVFKIVTFENYSEYDHCADDLLIDMLKDQPDTRLAVTSFDENHVTLHWWAILLIVLGSITVVLTLVCCVCCLVCYVFLKFCGAVLDGE